MLVDKLLSSRPLRGNYDAVVVAGHAVPRRVHSRRARDASAFPSADMSTATFARGLPRWSFARRRAAPSPPWRQSAPHHPARTPSGTFTPRRHPARPSSTVVASAAVDALGEETLADGVVARHAILRLEPPRADVHYLEAALPDAPPDAPAVLLLHGFPDWNMTWRRQIPPLVRAGYRVLAPNLRGYAKSGKPEGVDAYAPAPVTDDLAALLDARGVDVLRAVVGHDWGAAVSFAFADRHASRTRKLVVLNGVHPTAFLDRVFSDPAQFLKSYYVGFFQIPAAPEAAIAFANHAILRLIFRVDPASPMSRDEEDALVAACAEPGAMRAALNYYRAAGPTKNLWSDVGPCHAPAQVQWGSRDRYLQPELAEPPESLATRGTRVVRHPNATHWVHWDEPKAVADALLAFLDEDEEEENRR